MLQAQCNADISCKYLIPSTKVWEYVTRYFLHIFYWFLVCVIVNYGRALGCALEAPSPSVRHRLGLLPSATALGPAVVI